MEASKLCIFLIFSLVHRTLEERYCNRTDLVSECLLARYDKYLRPGTIFRERTTLHLSMNLLSINDVDLKHQTVNVELYLNMTWKDDRLAWNSSALSNVTWLSVDSEDIWKPDLTMSSLTGSLVKQNFKDNLVKISANGIVSMFPYYHSTLGVEIDVSNYPFDTQNISFNFETWSYTVSDLLIFLSENHNPVTFLAQNGEWEVEDYNMIYWNATYGAEIYHKTGYSLRIRRKPLYYVLNVFAPISIVSLLNILCFLLPVSSGERGNISISIFLTLIVFLTYVSDSLPKTSQGVPFCVIYIGLHMTGSALAIVMVVIITWIENQGSIQDKVSPEALRCNCLYKMRLDLNMYHQEGTERNTRITERSCDGTRGVCPDNIGHNWKLFSKRLNSACLCMSVLWNLFLFIQIALKAT